MGPPAGVCLLVRMRSQHEPRRQADGRAVAGGAQRGNWHAQADAAIAENFGDLVLRHSARLVAMAGAALTTTEEIMSGDGLLRDGDGHVVYTPKGEAVMYDPRHLRNRLD